MPAWMHTCMHACTCSVDVHDSTRPALRLQVLMDLLMGKRCGLNVQEGAYWRSIGGEQAPVDLEMGMQLIYALFTTSVTPVPEELDTCMQCAPLL